MSPSTLEDLIRLEREIRERKAELRDKTNSLVEDRLARRIGAEQYAADRRAIKKEAAECSRRERVLDEEMAIRHNPLRSGSRITDSDFD